MAFWNDFVVGFVGAMVAGGFAILGRRMWLDHVRVMQMDQALRQVIAWVQSVQDPHTAPPPAPEKDREAAQ